MRKRIVWSGALSIFLSFFVVVVVASTKWNCNVFPRLFSPIHFSLFDFASKSFPVTSMLRLLYPHQALHRQSDPHSHTRTTGRCNLQCLTPKWIGLCFLWTWAVCGSAETCPRMKKLGQCECQRVLASAKKRAKKWKLFFIVIAKSEMRTRVQRKQKLINTYVSFCAKDRKQIKEKGKTQRNWRDWRQCSLFTLLLFCPFYNAFRTLAAAAAAVELILPSLETIQNELRHLRTIDCSRYSYWILIERRTEIGNAQLHFCLALSLSLSFAVPLFSVI